MWACPSDVRVYMVCASVYYGCVDDLRICQYFNVLRLVIQIVMQFLLGVLLLVGFDLEMNSLHRWQHEYDACI